MSELKDEVTKLKDPSELSSGELLGRVRKLEQECEEILRILIDHGQTVAANKMDDAVTGLHKTRYCWNTSIEWDRPHL